MTLALPATDTVDYAYGRPSPAQLIAAGVFIVCRYLPDTYPNHAAGAKSLTRSETVTLAAGRVAVIGNWERSGHEWRLGLDKGVSDGFYGRAAMRSCGLSDDCPIYQSIDEGVPDSLIATALAYQRGFNRGADTGYGPQGAYGPPNVLQAMHDAGLLRPLAGGRVAAWQWGGAGATLPFVAMRQHVGAFFIGGVQVDRNTRYVADAGQYPRPDPPAPPVPVQPVQQKGGDDMADAVVRIFGFANRFSYPVAAPISGELEADYDKAVPAIPQVVTSHVQTVAYIIRATGMRASEWVPQPGETAEQSTFKLIQAGPQ